jgi:hypothetical protein
MKVIVINKKRLGVTIIILGLMLILFGAEAAFDARLKSTALMHSNIDVLKEYEGLDGKFQYKLPEQWTINLKDYGSTEILYHNEFTSDTKIIHGYVQVWNFRGNLKDFVERGKDNSAYKPFDFKEYNMKPININEFEGYLVTYAVKDTTGEYHKAQEYYLPKGSRLFRFSFYVNEKSYKESMPTVFRAIVKTLQYESDQQ